MSTVNDTINEIKSKIARLDRKYEVTFDLMTDKELRENREQRARLVKQLGDLEHKQERDAATEQDMREVAALLAQGNIHEQWKAMPFTKKQKLIRLVTESITLDEIGRGWFKLTLVWSHFLGFYEVDTAYIWRQQASGTAWTDAEKQLLRDHYATANRSWILEQLPSRTWASIRTYASKTGLSRQYRYNDTTLSELMSIEDIRIMDEHGLELDQSEKRVWWKKVSAINRDSIPS